MSLKILSLSTARWLTLLAVLSSGAAGLVQSLSAQEDEALGETEAVEMTRAYLAGIPGGGGPDALDGPFGPGERSSIYENGSDEGTWLHYKEHHLAPEQEHAKDFRFTTKEETTERCGDGFLVLHVGGFTLEAEGQTRSYRAAVSFTVVPVDGVLRILHLHWSSRQMR